jgi:hypothetical protein
LDLTLIKTENQNFCFIPSHYYHNPRSGRGRLLRDVRDHPSSSSGTFNQETMGERIDQRLVLGGNIIVWMLIIIANFSPLVVHVPIIIMHLWPALTANAHQ